METAIENKEVASSKEEPYISKVSWERGDDEGSAYGFLVVDHKNHNISFKTFLNENGVSFSELVKFALGTQPVKDELEWYGTKHTRHTAYRATKHKTKNGGTCVRMSTYVPIAGKMCQLNSTTAFKLDANGLTKGIHTMKIGTFVECLVKLYGIRTVQRMVNEAAPTIHRERLRTVQSKHVTTKCTRVKTFTPKRSHHAKANAKAKPGVNAEAETAAIKTESREPNYTTRQWEVDAFDRHYRSGKVTRVSAHTRRRHCLEEN